MFSGIYMERIIFFLYYRAGSTFFESLLGKEWRRLQSLGYIKEAADAWFTHDSTGKPFYLPTIPPCPSSDIAVSVFGRDADPYSQFAWTVHVGDWWGQLRSDDIPGPWDLYTTMRWGPDELRDLPDADWKFVSLIRDGRNQVESLYNFKGGIEEKLKNEDPIDYFRVLCKGFRNRARVALECEKQLSNYAIFRSEDLFSDTIPTVERMFNWVGLNLDKTYVQDRLDFLNSQNAQRIHSSFCDANFNCRWQGWPDWKRDTFQQIAGIELVELGYTW